MVAWTDADGDGAGNSGVQAKIFNNAGVAVTGNFALNTTTAGTQNEVSLVATRGGGFMAIWEDDTALVDRGQLFNALGNKIGTEFVVKTNPGAVLATAQISRCCRMAVLSRRSATSTPA